MDIDIKLSKVEQDELLDLYSTVKSFISYLETEIETSEIEKKK